MHVLGRIRAAMDRVTLVGADPGDDEDLRARKALLVLISVLILPVAALWGALYLGFGSPVGVVPLVYFAVLLGGIGVFSRTRDFAQLLRVGQVAILLAPTLSMMPLGGFLEAGGVGLWGILAPLGALVFNDVRSAALWYVAYLVVFLGSGIAGEITGPIWEPLPRWFTSAMLGLNVAVGGAIVFTLLAVFAKQRRDALDALREEQAKAENLLLNILPRSIADKLKADAQPIADQFGSVSILFADVADFTPWSERLGLELRVGIAAGSRSTGRTRSRRGTSSARAPIARPP
jgi:guanylate cyclase